MTFYEKSNGFKTNNMKLNKDKCHILNSGHKYENVCFQMEDKDFGSVLNKNYLRLKWLET